MITTPPYLKKGDTIGIIAPSGFMPFEKMQSSVEKLQNWGYQVRLGNTTTGLSENYFSGTDKERLDDLQQMLDDENVKAIFCARGGYGLSRIVDAIKFKKFKKHPKWIIGFSDITVLHAHIFSNYKIASLHSSMASAFNDDGYNSKYTLSIKEALEGVKMNYTCTPHPLNILGKAEGILVGGNLSLIAHLIGSNSDIKTKHKILFLEDVGEYLYNIDRMMLQLKRSGKFNDLAGLIIGGFTDCKDTERPYGKSVYDIISDQLSQFDFPVCYNFPVSHGTENVALKIGAECKLSVKEYECELIEV